MARDGILQATKIRMIKDRILDAFIKPLTKYNLSVENIDIVPTNIKGRGHFSTNYALVNNLTSEEKKILKDKVVQELNSVEDTVSHPFFEAVEYVEPGFVNFTIGIVPLTQEFQEIQQQKMDYGKLNIGSGKNALIEIVSANPTGPIHLGNARGGPIGDVLANLFEFYGYKVSREFYLNNIGGQVNKFKDSIKALYSGSGDGEYSGDFYENLAKEVMGDSELAFEKVIASIKKDLEDLGVDYEKWVSESKVKEEDTGKVVEYLKEKGLTKQKEGALWFAPSDEFLEDRECVLLKSDEGNTPTYFANDIAYHKDKYDRGYDCLVNIWGANHHGHVPRIKAAVKALGYDENKLEVVLYQWVSLIENGKKKSMSKRKGDFVTLREVLDEVGKDPIRFAFLTRDYNTPQDIDLDVLVKKDKENPLYYIQYVVARVNSILAKDENVISDSQVTDLRLDKEMDLILKTLEYPDVIKEAFMERKVHKIAFYLYDLAAIFHKYYEETPILKDKSVGISTIQARIELIKGVKQIIENGLTILGIDIPEKM